MSTPDPVRILGLLGTGANLSWLQPVKTDTDIVSVNAQNVRFVVLIYD